MKKFANLLEQLLFTYSTNKKIDILATYLKSLNHKEKGITVAVLTGNLNFKNIKRSNILNIIKSKLDWYLFCLLYTSPSPRDCDRSRMPSSA